MTATPTKPVKSPTLLDRVESATEHRGAITFLSGDGPGERVEWARLHEEARAMAAGLQARGIGPGDHVSLLGMTSRPLVTAVQAIWLTGAAVVVLPLPMRLGSIDEFVAQTRARVRNADTALLVVDADLAAFIEPAAGDPPMVMLDQLSGRQSAYERPEVDPSSLAILQFTSGSTADPKGVMLPHAQVGA